MQRQKEKYCRICGRPITNPKRFYYCGWDCETEMRRRRALAFKGIRVYEPHSIAAELKHGVGYGYLAQAIVNTAIEDIRACSSKEIERYENPAYRTRITGRPYKMMNYFDAKTFLLGERITGITGLDGEAIWKMLLNEKGIEI